ncbi:MAG: hypothetical protein AUK34_06720 [Ignavibacteria bacterium CG2_30_36_16]|nr:MAG: hypothetical protein AUK34_06720 [Ignavibacteria bacterium CG2_30_36_16]PJA99298.1 MAG: hypothetical protein CO127_10900 [Ignavibacteria bacterium CG_4_9_14_3_um_filter_36_18]
MNELGLKKYFPSLRATLWERGNLKILNWDCFIRGLIRNDKTVVISRNRVMKQSFDFALNSADCFSRNAGSQ